MEWTLILGIAVVVFGTFSAGIAIFGETHQKDGGWKLTRLGWAALGCYVVALGTGVAKEVLTQKEAAQQQAENASLRVNVAALGKTADDLRGDLKEANATIVDTRSKVVTEQQASQKVTEAILAYVFDRLSLATSRYVSILARMIGAASDGWLPSNKKELFSKESFDLFCRRLNAEAQAPVSPAMPWHQYFAQQSQEYQNQLVNVLNSYSHRLPPTLTNSVAVVSTSWLVTLGPMHERGRTITAQKGFKNSPMICVVVLDDRMEKGFKDLGGLVALIEAGEKKYGTSDRMSDRLLLSSIRSVKLGEARLSDNEVRKFLDSQKR